MSSEFVSSITKLGFSEELAIKAYKTNDGNAEKTINFLKKLKKHGGDFTETQSDEDGSEYDDESTGDDNDPLQFIKGSKKLKALKSRIYQEVPENINAAINTTMLAISMGDWEEIANNQESFLELLSINDEIKQAEDLNCNSSFSADDIKQMQKITSLGYPDYLVEQAFCACERNLEDTINLLKN